MNRFSRRDMLKTSMAVPAAATTIGKYEAVVQMRERSLLDFSWRFHFGHATDAAKDFGFGAADPSARATVAPRWDLGSPL